MNPFFYILGIGNSTPNLTHSTKKIISENRFFSGGLRHYDLVKKTLPNNHIWIEIKTPIEKVFKAYEKKNTVVIFSSGDPLFFGFANTLKRQFLGSGFKIIGYKNSVQILCERLQIATNDIYTISLHGRNSWNPLGVALMRGAKKIAIFTDAIYTPAKIAEKMLYYGYKNYQMHIGENLENDCEKISAMDLKTVQKQFFHPLNIALLVRTKKRKKFFGIPDNHFVGLKNRPNMITKMPIRLATLHFLRVHQIHSLWDIGFCTGAVSIEALLQNPQLKITAFEKNKSCENLIKKNAKKMGAMGIEIIMGDFFIQDLKKYAKPDAVFIGGHSGNLMGMFALVNQYLKKGGRVVCNAVLSATADTFQKILYEMGYEILPPLKIKAGDHNEITVLCAEKNQNIL